MSSRLSPFSCRVVAEALEAAPLCVSDVGAAGGIDPLWRRHGAAGLMRFYGFEPSPENFRRLEGDAVTEYHPLAIADRRGEADFYVCKTVGSLSPRPDRERAFGETYDKITVRVETLDHLRASGTVRSLDVVKIDVEGHDVRVVRGIGPFLRDEVLCVKSEFSFDRASPDSGFAEMDRLLTDAGLRLFDFSLKDGLLGELAGGDVLYLRDVRHLLAQAASRGEKRTRVLKLVAVCLLLRNPGYAHIAASAARDAGVLGADEAGEIQRLVERSVFVPAVVPRHNVLNRLAHGLCMVSQVLMGPKVFSKSSPRDNRLERYRPLFVDARLVPRRLRERYRARLRSAYDRYKAAASPTRGTPPDGGGA